jgi:hypothetical protein
MVTRFPRKKNRRIRAGTVLPWTVSAYAQRPGNATEIYRNCRTGAGGALEGFPLGEERGAELHRTIRVDASDVSEAIESGAMTRQSTTDEVRSARALRWRLTLFAGGLAQLHAIYKRAQKVYGIAVTPSLRQPQRCLETSRFSTPISGGDRLSRCERAGRRFLPSRCLYRPSPRRATGIQMGRH